LKANASFAANFLCTAVVSGGYPYFEWVSQWQIQVNTTWGEYAFCNFGTCIMGDDHLVGREAANGLGEPLAGQVFICKILINEHLIYNGVTSALTTGWLAHGSVYHQRQDVHPIRSMNSSQSTVHRHRF